MDELCASFLPKPQEVSPSPLMQGFSLITSAFDQLKKQSLSENDQLRANLEAREAEIQKYKMEMASLELELRNEKQNNERLQFELDGVKDEMCKYRNMKEMILSSLDIDNPDICQSRSRIETSPGAVPDISRSRIEASPFGE